MSSPAGLSQGPPTPADDFQTYLGRLLAGPVFAPTTRRGRLLRYLLDRSRAGEGEQITEYAIGLDVLGRPPSFDTRIDSSVRAEISRLRRQLLTYYEEAGRADPWRIDLPQRGYIPVITRIAAAT